MGADREAMATHCGVSRATTSNWETDSTNLATDNLFKVAEFLGVSPYELWFGQPEPSRPAIPEFERVRIRSQAQLKSQALQCLDDLKSFISELEPRSHVHPKTQVPTPRKKRPPRKADD